MGLASITQLANNTTADALAVDANFNALAAQLNGNLDATNIKSGGITTDMIANNALAATKFTNPYKFSVYQLGDLNVTAGVWTKAPLNSKTGTGFFDTSNNFDAVTNYRFTAPISGFYLINAQIGLSLAGYGSVSALGALYKNGNVYMTTSVIMGSGTNAFLPRPQMTRLMQLAAGDYIELWGRIDDPSRAIQGAFTWMDGFLVSTT